MTDDSSPNGRSVSGPGQYPAQPDDAGRRVRPVQDERPLLSVTDLRVVIDGLHILHGVDLDVAASGVTALLGRNGAGKTTTVRAIMGLVPRTGRLLLGGTDLVGLATHQIVRQGVGYAPEDRGIFAGLTVAENLRLAERDAEPAYDLVYELFPELGQRSRQPAGTLSGGQQQMVAIGRTLLNRNRLIIADEPTKGLAPKIVSEVADVLARAAEQLPVLLVEQNLALVRRLAHRCAVLADGRTAHQGLAAELLADEEASRRLLGVGNRRPAATALGPGPADLAGPAPAASTVGPAESVAEAISP